MFDPQLHVKRALAVIKICTIKEVVKKDVLKEVVKKEVLKLLNAGIIYPISDSKWVSPVQVVPKKGGMTVVQNDKNVLIPIRTVTG